MLCGLALLAAACGDDDDERHRRRRRHGETTTTDGGGGGGELVGAKGTTPAPETTDAVTDFQARMDAHAEEAGIDLDGPTPTAPSPTTAR